MIKCELTKHSGKLVVTFAGQLTEESIIESVDAVGCKEIVLDLKRVASVNSSGVQAWIKWLRKLPSDVQLVFENVPVQFVYHLSSVAGMVPRGSDLLSFEVPYFNAKTDEVEIVVFKKEQHFTARKFSLPARVGAQEDSKIVLTLDTDARRYFAFLKTFFPEISLSL